MLRSEAMDTTPNAAAPSMKGSVEQACQGSWSSPTLDGNDSAKSERCEAAAAGVRQQQLLS